MSIKTLSPKRKEWHGSIMIFQRKAQSKGYADLIGAEI